MANRLGLHAGLATLLDEQESRLGRQPSTPRNPAITAPATPGLTSHKYCHNGGHGLRPPHSGASRAGRRVGPEGSAIAIVVPVVVPSKAPICRGNVAGSGVRALWGSNGLVCLECLGAPRN
jgi:hypothetical protein